MVQQVSLIDKKSHQEIKAAGNSDKINLSQKNPTVIQINASQEEIKEFRRDGGNLIIVLQDGKTLTIVGFFDADHSVVLQDNINNKLLWAEGDLCCFK